MHGALSREAGEAVEDEAAGDGDDAPTFVPLLVDPAVLAPAHPVDARSPVSRRVSPTSSASR